MVSMDECSQPIGIHVSCREKSDPSHHVQSPSSPAVVERLRVVMCDDISESPFVSDCRMGAMSRHVRACSHDFEEGVYGEVTLSPWMSASPRPVDTADSSAAKINHSTGTRPSRESLSFYDMNPMVGF